MQIAFAVAAAVDQDLDVIACPGVTGAEQAAAAEIGMAAAAEALEHTRRRTLGHRRVVGSADPFKDVAGKLSRLLQDSCERWVGRRAAEPRLHSP
jgi:hypothetical protein